MKTTLHIHNTTSNTLMEFDVIPATGQIIGARPAHKELWENWKITNRNYEKGMLLKLRFGHNTELTLKHPVINITHSNN